MIPQTLKPLFLRRSISTTFHTRSNGSQHQGDKRPRLVVTPRTSLFYSKTTICAQGIEPSKPVTLKAEMTEDNGKLLYSNGHFVANCEGKVDTSFSASIGGSYMGVFPSGLLSLLKMSSGHYEFGRIHKNNMQEPIKFKISLQDGHIPIDSPGPSLDSTVIERHLMGQGVQRIPVREGRVRGVLYVPEGDGPFPGVIDMFGGTGFLNETRAALNASRGFASLALAYFNYDDIPLEKILDLDLDYFEEATEFLLSHPKVKPEQCGVVANCMGGVLGLMMALHVNKVKAAFLINTPLNNFTGDVRYKGEVIVSGPETSRQILKQKEDGTYIPKPRYNEELSQVHESLISKIINAKDVHFAVALGEQDCYQFQTGWNKLEKILTAREYKRLSLKVYPRAGHLIHAPYSPFASVVYGRMLSKDFLRSEGVLLNFGGEALESVGMEEDTFQWMSRFFKAHLT